MPLPKNTGRKRSSRSLLKARSAFSHDHPARTRASAASLQRENRPAAPNITIPAGGAEPRPGSQHGRREPVAVGRSDSRQRPTPNGARNPDSRPGSPAARHPRRFAASRGGIRAARRSAAGARLTRACSRKSGAVKPKMAAENRRPYKDQGAGEAGDRIARQTKKQPVIRKLPEDHRLARPHGDFPEVEPHAKRAADPLHQVVIPDRGSANRHQQVEVHGQCPARAAGGVPPPRRGLSRDRPAPRHRPAPSRRGQGRSN